MPTQGERQEYLWRPNDNSSTTNLRYELEGEKWHKSIKSASLNNTSNSNSLGVISLILSLIFNIILLVIISITDLVKLSKKRFKNKY